ncbi:hypothetical protein [Romboutsia sp. 1001713B170207_170306_H8]|uniref:hypothetical protein n=1 Tax=Romboutsia sp. 1001713B170207_170306_H8 TaxID=2787112 RepID=UPI000821FF50|nr:hypothetical protein [Romboutsia sp. 1001713B170207_170306_H8]SCI44655.1 Uncharacterised protein [uncultured Clostridium sp.]
MSKEKKFDIESTSDLIQLLNVYENEWMHRDTILWSNTIKLFLAGLIVTILPYTAELYNLRIPTTINMKIFPIIGIVFSVILFFISGAYASRLTAIGNTIRDIISMLEYRYQRQSVLDLKISSKSSKRLKDNFVLRIFNISISNIATVILPTVLLILSIFVITTI